MTQLVTHQVCVPCPSCFWLWHSVHLPSATHKVRSSSKPAANLQVNINITRQDSTHRVQTALIKLTIPYINSQWIYFYVYSQQKELFHMLQICKKNSFTFIPNLDCFTSNHSKNLNLNLLCCSGIYNKHTTNKQNTTSFQWLSSYIKHGKVSVRSFIRTSVTVGVTPMMS